MEQKGKERKIVPIDESFTPLLYAAALEGCDISPMIDGVRYVGFGHGRHGYGPVCLVDIKETPYVVEPHVTWLPWCPAKERVAAFKWAMRHLGKDKQVMLIVLKEFSGFYEKFARRGFLRKIGFLNNLPKEAGEEIHMYQYVRKDV